MDAAHLAEQELRRSTPNTYQALHDLVTAMAYAVSCSGRTAPARIPSGDPCWQRFISALASTISAMKRDNVVSATATADQVLAVLHAKLQVFSDAFPKWENAYAFAEQFLVVERHHALATIDMLRQEP